MSTTWRYSCALMFALLGCGFTYAEDSERVLEELLRQPAETVAQKPETPETATSRFGDLELIGYDDPDSAATEEIMYEGVDSCGPGGCGGVGCGFLGMPGYFVFGGEYLSVRANFSEATAYRIRNGASAPPHETFEQFAFDYDASYRLYGGYRLCECGCEVRFAYSELQSGGSFDSGPLDSVSNPLVTVVSPFEVIPVGNGDRLTGTAQVDLNDYDLSITKTIPLGCLGGPACCSDGCTDACGCGPVCAAWDVEFTGAIRVVDYASELNYASVIDPANNPGGTISNREAKSRVSFEGVGLRGGVLGRRYFGRRGLLSAYVKGDISLLLGEVDTVVYGNGPTSILTWMSSQQVVPVTELEAGITGYLTNHISISTGYMLSAWHDLGHRTEYDFSGTTTPIVSMDDANMLTFDGFFLRAEAAF